MAKLTFTADDGSIQEFDVVMTTPAAPIVATITGVEVEESDGSTETFTPAN